MDANKLTDEERQLWRPLAYSHFAESQIHDKNKAIFLIGHRACFAHVVAEGRRKYEQELPPPVLNIFWNTDIRDYNATMEAANALMKAAVLGGMEPAAAKAAVEQVFADGWTSGSCDQNYSTMSHL